MTDKSKFFFHQTLSLFQEYKIQNKKMIVGVSAGIDSMVLLDLLKELSSVCKLKLYAVHIHHGHADEKKINHYRNKAEKFMSDFCKKSKLAFLNAKYNIKNKTSEEAYRNFRQTQFKRFLKEKKADLIVLAHNANDLLETRLINLIRGCGEMGLKSMPHCHTPYLRPLLSFSRTEITNYAKIKKINFIEDPSNQDNSYLRNWIRNKWLKELEKKRTGSIKTLSRSLEALSSFHREKLPLIINENADSNSENHFSFQKEKPPSIINSKGIQRKLFIELNKKDQKRTLAVYMRQLNLPNYGQSHIEELLKNNERTQKQFTVKLLKHSWFFSVHYITCSK